MRLFCALQARSASTLNAVTLFLHIAWILFGEVSDLIEEAERRGGVEGGTWRHKLDSYD
jgi:hypothetical protein